tara:strand:- start:1993 stop:2349 length:357 start_codon:yes stop_codon:yes gene_type:complete
MERILKLKKIVYYFVTLVFLTGCVETTALLGPAVTGGTSGNIYQASISFVSGEAVSKTTGKYPMQHVKSFLDKAQNSKLNKSLVELKEEVDNFRNDPSAFYASVKKLYIIDKNNFSKD